MGALWMAEDPAVLYLNFDGGTLVAGSEDAAGNVTAIGMLEGSFPPYGDSTKRAAVIQAVHEDWTLYNAVVTDERPDGIEYVMCMIGPSDAYPSSTLGIAPLDCDDEATRSNITFAFHSADDSHSASATATTVSQEIAHSFGLEHVGDPDDIMNPYNVGGDPSFTDACVSVVGEPECGGQHIRSCGSTSMQNAHQELLDIIGPSNPDENGPGIELIAPVDGEAFADGEAIDIVVTPDEELDIMEMSLYVNGSWTDSDDAPPYGWTASGIDAGEYEIFVEAVEHDGRRVATDTVVVTVGDVASSGIGDPDLAGSRGFGSTNRNACDCNTNPRAAPLALFFLLGLRRRR